MNFKSLILISILSSYSMFTSAHATDAQLKSPLQLKGAFSHDAPSTVDEPKCDSDARRALLRKYNIPLSSVTFFNGALVGDGVDAIEIDMYVIAQKEGLYKVELDGEMCELRNIEFVNNLTKLL
jgi:hypothetical protein